jgi:toxin CcdB
MQHDLFANPNRRARVLYPLIVALHANVVDGPNAMIAPLTLVTARTPNSRLLPVVEHEGARYAVVFTLMTALSTRRLLDPVGSIAHYRDDLIRAIDWLFCGI